MSIGEFAQATGLSVSAVRFYANQGVLQPAQIDSRSGYRRFAADQVADGQLIRNLRQLEMPLPSIARALRLSEAEQRAVVQAHLDELTASLGRVHTIAQSLGTAPNKDTPMTNDASTTTGSVTLAARSLAAALGQVLPVASTDPAVPHLMTVLLEARDGSLRIVSTDRHRLAVRELIPTRFGSPFSIVLAAATLTEWQQRLDVEGNVSIETTATKVHLSEAVDASFEIVPTDYPDYQSVLDTPAGVTTVTADSEALTTALLGRTQPTTLGFADRALRLDGDDSTATTIATAHTGPAQSVLVNPSYVRAAVTATVGREVVIDITDPLRPLVIRSADDSTFTSLVMPIAAE